MSLALFLVVSAGCLVALGFGLALWTVIDDWIETEDEL
jgi:hypothetical protein